MADEEDETALFDLEIDVIQRSRPVGVDERNAAESDHALEGTPAQGFNRYWAARSPYLRYSMNFDLSDEQKAIQSLCRDFAREEVAPQAEHNDREERFPYELVRKMAELQLVHNAFHDGFIGAKCAALPQHGVYERGLAVVNVGDNSDVANNRIQIGLF